MKIKLLVNKISSVMNKIQNFIIFAWSLCISFFSVIILLCSRHFHFYLLALAISFTALTAYLFLKNKKNENVDCEEANDKKRPTV